MAKRISVALESREIIRTAYPFRAADIRVCPRCWQAGMSAPRPGAVSSRLRRRVVVCSRVFRFVLLRLFLFVALFFLPRRVAALQQLHLVANLLPLLVL